jgi:hypothetical protein
VQIKAVAHTLVNCVANLKRNKTESVIGLTTDADNTFRLNVVGVGETGWLALIGIPMPKTLTGEPKANRIH